MALAETAELAVKLTLDDSQVGKALGRINRGVSGLTGAARNAGKGIALGIGVGTAAAIGVLGSALHDGIKALKDDAVVAATTTSIIKSTGGVAGITADHVAKLADKLSILDGVQDDVAQSAANVFLTFTNVGKNVFDDATAAALDMAAALGTDPSSSAQSLGKALQDPVKGMTTLRRAGVLLTDEQQKQIRSLIKQGDLYGAQKIILGEVEKKFHDVAKAQADADPSRRLNVALEKAKKALARGLLPAIEKISIRLTEFLSKPETLAALQKLGDTIASLFTDQNLNAVASGLETAAKAVGLAISAFNGLPPEIKALAIGAFAINKVTGGAVGGVASAFGKILGAGLQKIFAANVTVIGTNVSGGGGGLPGATTGGGGRLGRAIGAVGKVFVVGMAVAAAAELAGQLGQQSTEIQRQGAGLVNQTRTAAPQLGEKSIVDAIHQIDDQMNDPLRAMALIITNPLNKGLTNLQTTRQVLADQLTQLRTTTGSGDDRVAGRIDRLNAEAAKTPPALAGIKTKEQESLIAFRAGERATQGVGAKLNTANSRLAAIRAKRTSFTVNVAPPRVSITDVTRKIVYRSSTARVAKIAS